MTKRTLFWVAVVVLVIAIVLSIWSPWPLYAAIVLAIAFAIRYSVRYSARRFWEDWKRNGIWFLVRR